MKTKALLFLIMGFSLFSNAQKMSIKKGKIKKDDIEIAKIEGKGGGYFSMYKGTISSLADTPLIKLEEKFIDYKNPLLQNIHYVEAEFLSLKQVVKFKTKENNYSNKQAVDLFFPQASTAMITNDNLDAQAVAEIIKQNPYDFQADSMDRVALWTELSKPLNNIVKRDMSQPVQLKATSSSTSGGSTYSNYEIYQADVLLGKLAKRFTPSDNPAFMGACSFEVSKDLEKPYVQNAVTYNRVVLANLSISVTLSRQYINVFRDGKKLASPVTNVAAGEKELVETLIKTGYL